MNKHTNKNKTKMLPILFIREVETDHMPAEVATGLLCESKRSTNRERKTWMEARSKHYESTRQPKSADESVAQQLRQSKWAQLTKWWGRIATRRALAQANVQTLVKQLAKLGTPAPDDFRGRAKQMILTRALAQENQRGSQLDSARDSLEDEIVRRKRFVQSVSQVAPSIAEGMTRRMVAGE